MEVSISFEAAEEEASTEDTRTFHAVVVLKVWISNDGIHNGTTNLLVKVEAKEIIKARIGEEKEEVIPTVGKEEQNREETKDKIKLT